MMLECWRAEPADRPLFIQLTDALASMFLSLRPSDELLTDMMNSVMDRASGRSENHYVDMDDNDEV